MRPRLLQQRKDLLPLHTGKTFEKVCNRVIGLQMVKQTLNRYPGHGEDRLASENFRISRNDFLHRYSIAPAATLCEAKVFRQQLREGAAIGASPFFVSLNACTAIVPSLKRSRLFKCERRRKNRIKPTILNSDGGLGVGNDGRCDFRKGDWLSVSMRSLMRSWNLRLKRFPRGGRDGRARRR
jgi:hypothetical protein